MVKGVNELKTLKAYLKYISCECRCEYDGRKYNSKQKQNNDKCHCTCKKPIKHRVFCLQSLWVCQGLWYW